MKRNEVEFNSSFSLLIGSGTSLNVRPYGSSEDLQETAGKEEERERERKLTERNKIKKNKKERHRANMAVVFATFKLIVSSFHFLLCDRGKERTIETARQMTLSHSSIHLCLRVK